MKKILAVIIFLFTYNALTKAQTLYSTTFNGGSNDAGTISKFIPATNQLTVATSLDNFEAYPYYTNFIQAKDGKLYGMTSSGGIYGDGAIFSYDPVFLNYTVLYNFDGTHGSLPQGSLMQANDGKLYGMADQGGSNNEGVIFSFDPASLSYNKLMDFVDSNGTYPTGTLIQSKDGKLYGMTSQGGSITSSGVIFSFDPFSLAYTMLKAFDFSDNPGFDNANPQGRLLEASDGKLYGMATMVNGFIFSYDPSSSTYTKLKEFDTTNGINPYGSLIQCGDGKLYGMTRYGGAAGYGTIFSYNPQDATLQKLKDFDSTNGSYPYGDLINTANGKFYGMTSQGGTTNAGTIFSFDPSSSVLTKLKDLDSITGSLPQGSLLQAGDGKLYAMTSFGTPSNKGSVFSFDPASLTFANLKNFGTNKTGSHISAGMLLANNGKLYGMANMGGNNGYGVIFSYDPITSLYTNLKDFSGSDGANPYGALIQGKDGKLYGMTSAGGNLNYGVIFSFDLVSDTYSKLVDFNFVNGATPYGNLMQDSSGLIYGITHDGGSVPDEFPGGVIFSYDPVNNIYTKLYNLDLKMGGNSTGSLIKASDGKLYGLESYVYNGIAFDGEIFSFNTVTNLYRNRVAFNKTPPDGVTPFGSFIMANDNKLYATTSGGGANGYGAILSYDPTTSLSKTTKVYDFEGSDGAYPYGNILQAANGLLYGVTYQGGASNLGTIFSYDLSGASYTHLADYNGTNGANPYYGSAFVEVPDEGPLPVTLLSFTGKNNGNNNQLTWKITSEPELIYYQLERSNDGQNFIAIAQIKNTGSSVYSYNDDIRGAVASTYFYRLKRIYVDGNFKYSDVVKLTTGINRNFAIVNPNPFEDKLVVTIQSIAQAQATFVLTDIAGKQLYKENKQLYKGINVLAINETNKLPQGVYMLTIITPLQSQTIKVVKGN